MAIHILGIRHHGVGSAKHVKAELEKIKPDIVLIEGPPEIAQVLDVIGDDALTPPVATMVYNSQEPKESTFYPFAKYSPEWVASCYANQNNIPLRAMDLPASIVFHQRRQRKEQQNKEVDQNQTKRHEPLTQLAKSAGYDSSEAWWEYHFEQTDSNVTDHFEGVMHVMRSLREEDDYQPVDEDNLNREAYMRSLIRQAVNEMYQNIAVICGAWHAPALTDLDQHAKSDTKRLKRLPKSKIKIVSTWIPWTNDRLSMFSGYGAGIQSPGWYEHIWKGGEDSEISWLTQVADTFRKKDIDISTAHVIEAYKLAKSLAIIRNKYYVSLEEMNDAILSVMCMGDRILLELVKKKLIVGNRLGQVPVNVPKVPLQEDFEQTVKKLRLKLTAMPKQHDLDLRKAINLSRSILFHRLKVLDIQWAESTVSRTKGTFKESWISQWSPELMIDLIDKAYLGNTIHAAAQAALVNQCNESNKIDEIAQMVKHSIPAQLFDQLGLMLNKINELSSISADIVDLMKGIPQLIEVSRYGDVRQSDLSVLNWIVQQLFVKVIIGLPNACYGLDEDNSSEMFHQISTVNHAIKVYKDGDALSRWYDTLQKVQDKNGVNPIILGCVCRLLLDAEQFTEDEADQRVSSALSANNHPHDVAAWLEGFLRGNGMILIYDQRIWHLLDQWVASLDKNTFNTLLPLLRRAFSNFEYGERKQIGQKAKKGNVNNGSQSDVFDERYFNREAAAAILPTLEKLIGNR